jgi:hypothetical protein
MLTLFSRFPGEDACGRIALIVAAAKGGVLDLILKNVAEKSIYQGTYGERAVLNRLVSAVVERGIVYGRDGLIEPCDSEQLNGACALLSPIATAAAEILQSRPDAKRLGLSRGHARVTPDTNLLECAE